MTEKLGRPSAFTDEIADTICERLAEGESLREICASDGMPNRATVFRWLAARDDFRDQYALAREAQAEALADDILSIADNSANDWMARNDPYNPGWTINGEAIARARLRVDSRKWVASKLLPKKYGERMAVEHDGTPVASPPLNVNITTAPSGTFLPVDEDDAMPPAPVSLYKPK